MQLSGEASDWPAAAWYDALLVDYVDQLQKLDDDPLELRAACDCTTKLQGHYFEALWAFWLSTNKRYRLVDRNVRIQDAARTIGELDFLVEDLHEGVYEHWEVAVKFFLGYGQTTSPACWYGPNQSDRLRLKVERLLTHQTQLTKTEVARGYLREKEIEIARSRVVMKGRLFYPREVEPKAESPRGAGLNHERGWWTTVEGFDRMFADDQREWLMLSKRDWFAKLGPGEAPQLPQGRARLLELRRSCQRRPTCVAAFVGGSEEERGFVVSDEWLARLRAENGGE